MQTFVKIFMFTLTGFRKEVRRRRRPSRAASGRRARRADDAGLADPVAAAAAEAEGAEGAAALGRSAPPCYVINLDRRPDRLLQTHKLLDGLAWLAWRRLEAVDGRGGELRSGELRDAVAPPSRELLGGGLDDPTPHRAVVFPVDAFQQKVLYRHHRQMLAYNGYGYVEFLPFGAQVSRVQERTDQLGIKAANHMGQRARIEP